MVKKTVIITGGVGFIGAHLVELLLKKKYKVVVVDIQKRSKNYFFLNKLDKKSVYKRIDITNSSKVNAVFAYVHPDYVIHLAAQPVVDDAYYHPETTFNTNIMGTVNILEACRKDSHIQGIIVASSDKAYGKTKTAYTEQSPLKGDHPYDVSKSCEDLIAQTYAKTYNMPVIVTRFGNVYGEGDLHFDRIVPGICKSLVTGRPFDIRSDGSYVRDYIYVKDVARGYLFLMKRSKKLRGEAYNFSSKDTCSVVQLVNKSGRALKKQVNYKIKNTAKNEIPYQHLDDAKIRKIGWKSKTDYQNALPNIYKWYKTFLS